MMLLRQCARAASGTVERRTVVSGKRSMSSVFTWGTGDDGQLGLGKVDKSGMMNTYVENKPTKVTSLEDLNVKDIACGFKHSIAITEGGSVYSWGKKIESLLGRSGNELVPMKVEKGLEGVRIVSGACGESHSAVISDEGNIYTWGQAPSMFVKGGGLGHGSKDEQAIPKQVLFGGSDEVKIKKVECGKSHTIALGEEGEVWTWGLGANGRLGNGGNADQLEPFPVEFFLEIDEECVDIAAGDSFCLALTKSGQIYGWGKNDQSQLGLGGGIAMDMYAMEDMPRLVENLEKEKIVAIGAGGAHALAINNKGEVFFWGMRLWMEPHKMTALNENHIVQVDCGHGYSVALSDAGHVFTWGKGVTTRMAGVMGHGDSRRCAQPEQISSLANESIRKISCGKKHVGAVTGTPDRLPKA